MALHLMLRRIIPIIAVGVMVVLSSMAHDYKPNDVKNYCKIMPLTDQLVLSPLGTTYVYLGSSLTITCTRIDDLEFFDEIGFSPSHINGSVHTPRNSTNGTLTALIDSSYNDTTIQCTGRSKDHGTIYCSVNTTTIRIQGYLASVKLHVAMKQAENSCKLKIHWDPPFTLPVPGIPILGYNVNITDTVTNETRNMSVNETQVHIPIGYYNVSVAGVNAVGEGNISTIHVDPTQFSTDFNISPDNVTVSRDENDWILQVIVDNHILCEQNNISINVINKVNTSINSTTRGVILNDNGDTIVSGTLSQLPEYHHYWVNININTGNYTRVSDNQSLSTFDVIDVEVLKLRYTCFNITYVKGHKADGCHINVYCAYSIISENLDFNITGNTDCRESKFLSLLDYTNNYCTIKAFDMVQDTIHNQNGPAVIKTNVPFFISSTSTLSTPSPTRSSPSSTPSQSVEPTIGGLAIGFISAFAAVTVILIIIVIIIGAIICLYKKRKTMKCWTLPAQPAQADDQ